jgi:hypothetical protein
MFMRGCLGFFFYIFITIWVIFGFLMFTAVRSWAFDREFYLDVTDNDALYEAIRADGLPELLANLEIEGQQVLNPNSPAFPALVEATQAILPTDFLRNTTVGLVNNLFSFFENPSTGLDLTVDLTDIKNALRGAQGDAFASTYINALETCETATNLPTNTLPTCLPQGVRPDQAIAVVRDYKSVLVNQIPDVWDLTDNANIDYSSLPSTSLVQGVNTGFTVTAIVTFVLWFFNALIGGRGFKGLLMWLGGMLFLPALIVLLSGAAFGGNVIDTIANEIITDTATSGLQASVQVQESLTLVILDALKRVGSGFLTTGIIALVVSLVLYIMGAVMRTPNRQIEVAYYNTSDSSNPIRPL